MSSGDQHRLAKTLARESAVMAGNNAFELAAQIADNATASEAREIAKKMVTQDAPLKSKRVWTAVFGVLTTITTALSTPEVQTALPAVLHAFVPPVWVPVASAIVTAVLPAVSKALDPRIVEKPQ